MELNGNSNYKGIYVDKLQEILATLEPGDIIYANRVGNLTILTEELDNKGYIDLMGDYLELWEPYLTQQILKEAKDAKD